MTDFDNIKVGDEVGLYHRWYGHSLGKVTKVTPKSFDIERRRFAKSDGFERSSSSPCYRAKPVDEKLLQEIELRQTEQQRETLARQLEPKLRTLSLEQLKRIEAIASGGEGEQ